MDYMVRDVQLWLNATYGERTGFNLIPESEYGKTGYITVRALIRALQLELGITSTADTFGPTTERYFNEQIGALRRQPFPSPPNNLNYILQGAFYCKGYDPKGFTGEFYNDTEWAVKDFQADIGFMPEERDGAVTAKIMKALLNTDGYRLNSYRGKDYIRFIQQRLNLDYANHDGTKWYFDYIPTDGVYGRATNTALIYALQIEEGIGDIANGNFGPSTFSNCPILSYGNTGPFVKILQWALACNGDDYYNDTPFDGIYDRELEETVRSYQEFMALPATGIADRGTIKQTLTSNGDTNRIAIACDTATIIDDYKYRTLLQYGYEYVGRYLTGNVRTSTGSIISKAMSADELNLILQNPEFPAEQQLSVFPIYQDGGYYAEYFMDKNGNYKVGRGYQDAYIAAKAARRLGFPHLVTIYFAVDFDAYDFEVTNLILPYFREIREAFNELFPNPDEFRYLIGVYGPRNICIRVSEDPDILAENSFVANMSTGFSGNLGFPMPQNWAFDQFHEYSIGEGLNKIGIDKCGYSGRDFATNFVIPPTDSRMLYDIEDRFMDICTKIPLVRDYPVLYSSEFEFDQPPIQVYTSPNLDIELQTQTGIAINIGDDIPVIRVENGLLAISTGELLGEEFIATLHQEGLQQFEDSLKNIALSIETGWIGFKRTFVGNDLEVEIKIISEDVAVTTTGNTIHLGVLIRFIIKNNEPDFQFPQPNPYDVITPIIFIAIMAAQFWSRDKTSITNAFSTFIAFLSRLGNW